MEIRGFEPLTYGLQSRRSSQLSYIPQLCIDIKKDREEETPEAGADRRENQFELSLSSLKLLP